MRVYRCAACTCGFVILAGQKKAGKVSCPLCKADDAEEIDPVKEGGGYLATKVLAWWKSLPEGE